MASTRSLRSTDKTRMITVRQTVDTEMNVMATISRAGSTA
jgi:hypothetical protein